MSYNLVDPTTGDLTQVSGGTLYADLPIGSWVKNDMDAIPSGFLKEGDTISQTLYPELYAKYGSTVPYKADTSELSSYNTPITFEQITAGYTMPYDGVLNIGANSTAGSVIAYVSVNGDKIVNIGATSYTGSFVRFKKGDVVKANNITSGNYILKVAYYTKSLIVKAKQIAVPFDMAEYIRNQNILSEWENCDLVNGTDKTMPYDGNLMITNSADTNFSAYINGVIVIAPNGRSTYTNSWCTIDFKKGDVIKIIVDNGGIAIQKVAYYKLRDYTGR